MDREINEKGQVILILILVMTVALAIGLSIVQKTLIDVSNASKVEQSARAFTAAEAGVEKALQASSVCGDNCISFTENNSRANVVDAGLTPVIATLNNRQAALEYPPIAKEDVAQVWLADFTSVGNAPAEFYNPSPDRELDVYWGNSSDSDKAAIELTLVYFGTDSKYNSRNWYLDSIPRNNGFNLMNCSGYTIGANYYKCKVTLGSSSSDPTFSTKGALPAGLMLIRARLLYNASSQPIAFQAVGICGTSCSLPPQARSIQSTGLSGETQRKVKVFQQNKVVPLLFNYALFSASEISK